MINYLVENRTFWNNFFIYLVEDITHHTVDTYFTETAGRPHHDGYTGSMTQGKAKMPDTRNSVQEICRTWALSGCRMSGIREFNPCEMVNNRKAGSSFGSTTIHGIKGNRNCRDAGYQECCIYSINQITLNIFIPTKQFN